MSAARLTSVPRVRGAYTRPLREEEFQPLMGAGGLRQLAARDVNELVGGITGTLDMQPVQAGQDGIVLASSVATADPYVLLLEDPDKGQGGIRHSYVEAFTVELQKQLDRKLPGQWAVYCREVSETEDVPAHFEVVAYHPWRRRMFHRLRALMGGNKL